MRSEGRLVRSDSCFALFEASLHREVASPASLGEDASRPFCVRKARVAYDALRTLLEALEVFGPALTRPGFSNFLVIFSGWVLTSGPHAITQALVVTGVAGRRHHEAFHRFFSRGAWNVDEMGQLLFNPNTSIEAPHAARPSTAATGPAPLISTVAQLISSVADQVPNTQSPRQQRRNPVGIKLMGVQLRY